MGSAEDHIELVDDMVNMVVLDEISILSNLRDRFKEDQIYTHVGAILISVNPYRAIPSLYSKEALKSFQAKDAQHAPHIFKITEAAYRRMLDYETDQSILISGESGAGKTEACKCILQYLADVSGQGGKIQQQILESNPLMEAFGNAKTVRNNNSSRFGKFIQLKFSRTGQLVGADITKYLLEKSRVVFQAPQERNYHIFYEMCAGLTGPLRNALHIGPAEEYKYLNQGKCMTIEGVSDVAQLEIAKGNYMADANQFELTKHAMKTIGIADDKQQQIFQVLAAILHIGNINFEFVKDSDSVIVKNEKEVDIAAKLLGIKSSTLNFALCHRDIIVSGQTFKKPLDLKQAIDSRDALAKGLYERIFDWLVDRINQSISSPQHAWHTIGVLDIFGFEFFDNNSLEQLCINYCNEKLQLMYNTHVFQQEQKEYQQEAINCEQVEFVDNQPCIDFFEKSLGVLSILDEECKFPAATDRTFLEKLEVNHKTSTVFGKELRANGRFLVRHFAGEVLYDVPGFLDKNRDSLRNELAVLVKKSELSFVKMLFSPTATEAPSSPTSGRLSTNLSNGTPSSVCSQFKLQLNNLMKTLASTSPHFIRCVKPNMLKLPDIFDEKLVSAQLRYTGVLGTIRIRQAGFPVRFQFDEFIHRYDMLGPVKPQKNRKKQQFASKKEHAADLAQNLDVGHYQVGKSKIFFKSPKAFDDLEKKRQSQLGLAAAKIQSLYRGRKQRRKYQQIKKLALAFQTAARAAHAYHLLLHLKEERARRLREEQIQRDKEQRLREEQMRKEKEQKHREKEERDRERERELKGQKVKQEEQVKLLGAQRHKFKYKYCTCGKAKEDEKENVKPNNNKANGMQLLKDLLDKYGAASIGNIYEDGRTIHVELYQYKYEFLYKDVANKAVPSTAYPKKLIPSLNLPATPPKPPAIPLKRNPLPKALFPKAAAPKPDAGAPLGGRGASGVSSSILSKINAFQKQPPDDLPLVSPRGNGALSARTPRGAGSGGNSPHGSGSGGDTVWGEGNGALLSPSGKENGALVSPGSGGSVVESKLAHISAPVPLTSPPAAPAAARPIAPAPPPLPAPTPLKTVSVLPKAIVRTVQKPPVAIPVHEGKEDRTLTFKEIRELMSKKLPGMLFSLATTLQAQQDEEFNNSANPIDTWEQYRNVVAPPAPVELQLLGSLTKERAKPQSRRPKTKAKAPKAAIPTPQIPTPAPQAPVPTSTPASKPTAPTPTPQTRSVISPTPTQQTTKTTQPKTQEPTSTSTPIPAATPLRPKVVPSNVRLRAFTGPSPVPQTTTPQAPSNTPPSYPPPTATQVRPRSLTNPLPPAPTSLSQTAPNSQPSSAPLSPPSATTNPPRPAVPLTSLQSRPTTPSSRPPLPLSHESAFTKTPETQFRSSSPQAQPQPAQLRAQPPSTSQLRSPSPQLQTPSQHQSQSASPQAQLSPSKPSTQRPVSQPDPVSLQSPSVIASTSPVRYADTPLDGTSPRNVVGVDPSTLTYVIDQGLKVPDFLAELKALLLKNKGLEKEGIFRVAGREDTITKLGQDISNHLSLECDDVLSIAAFLKRWYNRLPQKLLSQFASKDIDTMSANPARANDVLKTKLSETYYSLFWWLMALMDEVGCKQDTNKMGPKNLATLLAPVLIDVEMQDLHKNQKLIATIQHILEYHVSG